MHNVCTDEHPDLLAGESCESDIDLDFDAFLETEEDCS